MKLVLVVDDNENIAMALRIRMQASGYKARVVHDIFSAKKALDEEKPDVILLDLMLTDGSGFEVADYVRKKSDMEKLPIIFITASKLPEKKKQAMQYNCVRYFEKPYESSELLAVIDEVTKSDFEG